jgi:hypothetical protein
LDELANAAWNGDVDKIIKMLDREDLPKFLNALNSHGIMEGGKGGEVQGGFKEELEKEEGGERKNPDIF